MCLGNPQSKERINDLCVRRSLLDKLENYQAPDVKQLKEKRHWNN